MRISLLPILGLAALMSAEPGLSATLPTGAPTPGTPLSCDLTATFAGIECRELALRAAIDSLMITGSTRPRFHDLLTRQLTRIQFQTAKAEHLTTQRQRARGKSWLGAALAGTISLEHRIATTGTRALTPGAQRSLLDMTNPLRRSLIDLRKSL